MQRPQQKRSSEALTSGHGAITIATSILYKQLMATTIKDEWWVCQLQTDLFVMNPRATFQKRVSTRSACSAGVTAISPFRFLASLGLHTLFNSCSSVFLSAAEAVESVHQARPVRHHRQRTLNRGPIGYRAPSHRATTELQLCPPNINHLFMRTQQHRLRTKHSQEQTTYTTHTAVRYTQSSHVQRRVVVLLAIS